MQHYLGQLGMDGVVVLVAGSGLGSVLAYLVLVDQQ